jgi:dihydrofolate reductase
VTAIYLAPDMDQWFAAVNSSEPSISILGRKSFDKLSSVFRTALPGRRIFTSVFLAP